MVMKIEYDRSGYRDLFAPQVVEMMGDIFGRTYDNEIRFSCREDKSRGFQTYNMKSALAAISPTRPSYIGSLFKWI